MGHSLSKIKTNECFKFETGIKHHRNVQLQNDLCALMSGSIFIAGIHRFLGKIKTLSILTVPSLKIQKNTNISFGKVLRGKNSPEKHGQRGRGFIWTKLWTQTYFRSSLVTLRWSKATTGNTLGLPRRCAFCGLRHQFTTSRGYYKNGIRRVSTPRFDPFHTLSIELCIPFQQL